MLKKNAASGRASSSRRNQNTLGISGSHHDWGQRAGARSRTQSGLRTPSPPTPSPQMESAHGCLRQPSTVPSARRNLLLFWSTWPWKPCFASGQQQRVCFASEPLAAMGLQLDSYPWRAEVPQEPRSQDRRSCTCAVCSHTGFSCDLPTHVQGDPKMGVGKESSSSPRAFQETARPSFLVEALQPHDANYWASTKSNATGWDALSFIRESYFALTCTRPHQILKTTPPPPWTLAAHLPPRLVHEPDQQTDPNLKCNPA